MKYAVTEISESRSTLIVDAESEQEAFEAARHYDTQPYGEHTVTQKRFEVRPVQVVNEAQIAQGTETSQ